MVVANQLLAGRDAATAAYEQGMAKSLDTTVLEAQQQAFLEEMEMLNGMIQQMIRQNAAVAQDQTEYNRRSILSARSSRIPRPRRTLSPSRSATFGSTYEG